MKKTLLAGGLVALTLVGATGVALAQQAPDRAMRADADGDRRISRTEFVDRRVERLTALDTDRDGSITTDERRAARQARLAGLADARFDRLDANDDGSISRAEFDSARETAREARADRGGRALRAERRLARREARGPVVIAEVQDRAERNFARFDGDGDGFVTAAERQAARQTMRENRRERMMERRAARQASRQAPASE